MMENFREQDDNKILVRLICCNRIAQNFLFLIICQINFHLGVFHWPLKISICTFCCGMFISIHLKLRSIEPFTNVTQHWDSETHITHFSRIQLETFKLCTTRWLYEELADVSFEYIALLTFKKLKSNQMKGLRNWSIIWSDNELWTRFVN